MKISDYRSRFSSSTCLISISPVLIRYSLESRPEYHLSPLGSWIPDIGFHGSLGPSRQGADRADVAQCELWSSSCCSGNTTTLVTIVLEQSILCFILVTTFLFLFSPFAFSFPFSSTVLFVGCVLYITRLLQGTTGQSNKFLACLASLFSCLPLHLYWG